MEEDLTPLPSVRGISPYTVYTASNFQQRGGRGGGGKKAALPFAHIPITAPRSGVVPSFLHSSADMTRLCKSSSSSFLSLSLSAATSPYIRRRQLLNLDIYYAGIVVIYRGRREEEEDPIAAVSPSAEE